MSVSNAGSRTDAQAAYDTRATARATVFPFDENHRAQR